MERELHIKGGSVRREYGNMQRYKERDRKIDKRAVEGYLANKYQFRIIFTRLSYSLTIKRRV